jgi:hypothetical protein
MNDTKQAGASESCRRGAQGSGANHHPPKNSGTDVLLKLGWIMVGCLMMAVLSSLGCASDRGIGHVVFIEKAEMRVTIPYGVSPASKTDDGHDTTDAVSPPLSTTSLTFSIGAVGDVHGESGSTAAFDRTGISAEADASGANVGVQ